MLQTAIQLKQAIENIPKHFQPIGTCLLDTYNYQHNRDLDESGESSDQEDNIINQNIKLQELIGNIDLKDSVNFAHAPNFELTVYDIQYNFDDITSDQIKELFDKATPATYGDVKTLDTKIDQNVRLARDITTDNFKVDPELLNKLAQTWWVSFNDTVKVVPYKINLYGTDGHFKPHKDTPDKNMIGTLIIKFTGNPFIKKSGDNTSKGGDLRVIDKITGNVETWTYDSFYGLCMFYSDCIHEVTPIEGDWIRATITFKVYSMEPVESLVSKDSEKLQELKAFICELETPYGIILHHEYSYNTNQLNSTDTVIINVIKQLGLNYKLCSILDKFYGSDPNFESYGDDITAESNIYLLDEEYIKYAISPDSDKPSVNMNIPFYRVGKGILWKRDEDHGAMYTGNESRPREVDSIYISKAIIVTDI
jgi:hypothetical protein